MNALARRIARMIETDGPIGVGTFTMLALHDRESGFYATRESIGAEGAFVTAPEISQVFGELIGLWFAASWSEQGSPASPLLVDLGPGRATLMQDMLRALRHVPDLLEDLDVVLLESSRKLESVQRIRLSDASVPIQWVQQWNEIPSDRAVLVAANEFFDALPIRQFVITERGWCERVVVSKEGSLRFAASPQPVPLTPSPGRCAATIGDVYEICPAALSIAEEIGCAIRRNGGVALIVDYGHDGEGYGDTLQAVRRHMCVDVLAEPGEADLSAHVDFAALAQAVRRGGAVPHGPITQGDFLRAIGVQERGKQLARTNPGSAATIAAAVARLTAADAMGKLFKVLAIAPPDAPVPPGFR